MRNSGQKQINNAKFSKGSCGNISMQGVTLNNITAENIFYTNNADGLLDILAASKNFDAIQDYANHMFSSFARQHILYPEYIAKYDYDLNRLVSSPANDEAIKKYPPHMEGKCTIDRSQCIGIDDSETPLEYAYRTQTILTANVTSLKEYLGEFEDPYPKKNIDIESTITFIEPPAFPDAIDALVESGSVAIPILFRRKPCKDFGKVLFGNVSSGHGFEIELSEVDDSISITIRRIPTDDLKSQLLREQLISQIIKTHKIKLIDKEEDKTIFDYTYDDRALEKPFFTMSSGLTKYIENLIFIEETLHCTFDSNVLTVNKEKKRMAFIIAASLKHSSTQEFLDFDDEVRCDYDSIGEEVLNLNGELLGTYTCVMKVLSIELQGVYFSADDYIINYKNAKINNISSVRKAVRKKRKNIIVTMRPEKGYDKFTKTVFIKNIKVLPNEKEA